VSEAIQQGRRPELTGGGLIRSQGGCRGVMELRRCREEYLSDERVLGSSEYVEMLLKETEKARLGRKSQVSLEALGQRIAKDRGVTWNALVRVGRSRDVSRVRSVLAYVWLRHLGRSGRVLSQLLAVSLQVLFAAARKVEEGTQPSQGELERWCQYKLATSPIIPQESTRLGSILRKNCFK